MNARRLTSVLATAGALTACATLPSVSVGPSADGGPTSTSSSASTPATPIAPATNDLAGFLDGVLADVQGFWIRWYEEKGIDRPTEVSAQWIARGDTAVSRCGQLGSSDAAYCPADDTIYLGLPFMQSVLRATGDAGVAVVVAHEYAHNVQTELGVEFGRQARPTELQADCLAGRWLADADTRGLTDPGDLEEAADLASAVGDYAVDSPGHHGTPSERAAALQRGRSGEECGVDVFGR